MLFRRRRHPIGDQELSAYVDGQLPSAARARLEEHVEACAACREALEEMRVLRGALRELPRAVAPRSFALREADVRPPVAARPVGALGRAGPLLGGVTAAALVAFGALVGVDVGVLGTGSSQEAADLVASAPEEPQDAARQGLDELAPATGGEDTSELYGDTKKLADSEPDTGEARSSADGAPPPPGAPTPECPDCPIAAFSGGPELALTPECPPTAVCVGNVVGASAGEPPPDELSPLAPTPAASAQAEAAAEAKAEAEDDGRTPLRVAEGATAALALVAASSLALVWWRRRA